MEYNPFKTALSRDYLSKPMRELVNRNLLQGDILDYGCGNGTDSEWLWKDYHIQSWRYDKFNTAFKDDFLLDEHYDTITCFYVFNVIYSLEEHKQILERLKSMCDNLYIAVRSDDRAIKPTWKFDKANLCWLTPRGTYQRFYYEERVKDMFGDVEYIISDKSMKLFKVL